VSTLRTVPRRSVTPIDRLGGPLLGAVLFEGLAITLTFLIFYAYNSYRARDRARNARNARSARTAP